MREDRALNITTMGICPGCDGRLAIVEVIQSFTRAGTMLGTSYFKCENGCNKAEVLRRKRSMIPDAILPEAMFLEVIRYARSIGKKITKKDQQRELNLFMRSRRYFYNSFAG